ncbi:hypothetical protein ACWEVD_13690 [Nocardia thailandica]
MHDWPATDSSDIPTPELVAAWVVLDTVPSERIPLWAAHWLVRGHDGDALRRLAGASGTDSREVHDLLPDALADCAAPLPHSGAAAAQITFGRLARLHADSRASEKWILDKVCEIVAHRDYADTIITLPLCRILHLADEWGSPWGRPAPQLAEEIRNACQDQLATSYTTDHR